MGNCVCQASRHGVEPWTDDGEPETAARAERRESGEERAAGVEVRIRISKRRLQKLMAKAAGGAEGMTVEKVLAEIVSAGEVVVDGRHRRRWEPALQSIPEAAVES
ncbi:hypothetical protein BAE44_0013345 [Dichanthelium oligosanthes]|uniref:Uncharacterized protein n=1 Tax=Dichanthelium oligosanthes TaxID=888268 RepID=A0A1E5VKK3_9POAL|nr:hypothetical protein BAE44_0013345 [Dichanthelium oligosanthes]